MAGFWKWLSEKLWPWLMGIPRAVDEAAIGFFRRPSDVPVASVVAGRALIVGAICFAAFLTIGLLNPPLRSVRIEPGGSPPDGLVYALPKTDVLVSGHFDVVSCAVVATSGENNLPADQAKTDVQLTTSLTVDSITPMVLPDDTARYIINGNSIAPPLLGDRFSATLSDVGTLATLGKATEPPLAAAKTISDSFAQYIQAPLGAKVSAAGASLAPTVCRGLPIEKQDGTLPEPRSIPFSLRLDPVAAATTVWKPSGILSNLSDTVNGQLTDVEFTFQVKAVLGKSRELPSEVQGVVYRYPSSAVISVCRGKCVANDVPQPQNVIKIEHVPVLIAGNEAVLQVGRDWLHSGGLDLAFSRTGAPSTLSVSRESKGALPD